MDVSGKYPSNGYPEQKYDPVQAETGASSGVSTLPPAPGQVTKCSQPSPGSSPHHPTPLDTSYHPHENHDRGYLTPPGQAPGPAPGHVTPELRDIKPQPQHDNANIDTDKDLSESSIEGPNERSDDKSEYHGSSHLGGHEAGYQGSGGSGYYHHSDLSHPSYGGYSTAGPFPLSSPLARPRSNKNKANSGKRICTLVITSV